MVQKGGVRAYLHSNAHSARYMRDRSFRMKVSLYASLAVNLAFAAFKLVVGVWYASFGIASVAVYYIVLCAVRFLLTIQMRKGKMSREQEIKKYRVCGVMLISLDVALALLVIQLARGTFIYSYPGFMIYAVATYAFYCMVLAIVNSVRHRGQDRPIVAACKRVNLVTALVAMLSLQSALLGTFGSDAAFARRMNIATGGGVCLIVCALAVDMLLRAHAELRKNKREAYALEKHDETFTFTYSATEQEEIKTIRQKYVPRADTKMEQLRKLDKSAERMGMFCSIAIGVVGTLLLGFGLACTTHFTSLFALGVAVGLLGIAGIALAHPLFVRTTQKQREKLAPQIMQLSEELLRGA